MHCQRHCSFGLLEEFAQHLGFQNPTIRPQYSKGLALSRPTRSWAHLGCEQPPLGLARLLFSQPLCKAVVHPGPEGCNAFQAAQQACLCQQVHGLQQASALVQTACTGLGRLGYSGSKDLQRSLAADLQCRQVWTESGLSLRPLPPGAWTAADVSLSALYVSQRACSMQHMRHYTASG